MTSTAGTRPEEKSQNQVIRNVWLLRLSTALWRHPWARATLLLTPPLAWFLVDQLALYRLVGSPETMAVQMLHIRDVAAMPNVTLQVLPAIANPGVTSGFVLADESVYAEHIAGGFVYTGETASGLMRIFDSLRTEAYRGSESLRILEGMAEAWSGGNQAFPVPTVGRA